MLTVNLPASTRGNIAYWRSQNKRQPVVTKALNGVSVVDYIDTEEQQIDKDIEVMKRTELERKLVDYQLKLPPNARNNRLMLKYGLTSTNSPPIDSYPSITSDKKLSIKAFFPTDNTIPADRRPQPFTVTISGVYDNYGNEWAWSFPVSLVTSPTGGEAVLKVDYQDCYIGDDGKVNTSEGEYGLIQALADFKEKTNDHDVLEIFKHYNIVDQNVMTVYHPDMKYNFRVTGLDLRITYSPRTKKSIDAEREGLPPPEPVPERTVRPELVPNVYDDDFDLGPEFAPRVYKWIDLINADRDAKKLTGLNGITVYDRFGSARDPDKVVQTWVIENFTKAKARKTVDLTPGFVDPNATPKKPKKGEKPKDKLTVSASKVIIEQVFVHGYEFDKDGKTVTHVEEPIYLLLEHPKPGGPYRVLYINIKHAHPDPEYVKMYHDMIRANNTKFMLRDGKMNQDVIDWLKHAMPDYVPYDDEE